MGSVVLRADASAEIGTGHVMRCLALGQAVQERGGTVVVATRTADGPIVERLEQEGFRVVRLAGEPDEAADARATARLARDAGAGWVVADGYRFGVRYQEVVRQEGLRLMSVDDSGEGRFVSDILLNQNIHGLEASYHAATHTRVLLGPRYALLRREFRDVSRGRRRLPLSAPRRILVTMGGSDPQNCTAVVVEALRRVGSAGLDVRVVLGPAFRHAVVPGEPSPDAAFRITWLENPRELVSHMQWADMAVSAAGSTCWEYLCVGVPLAVGALAENQVPVARSLARVGLAADLGWLPGGDPDDLAARLAAWLPDRVAHARGRRLGPATVDGRGALRVTELMEAVAEVTT